MGSLGEISKSVLDGNQRSRLGKVKVSAKKQITPSMPKDLNHDGTDFRAEVSKCNYLTEEQLANIKTHRYSSVDKSYITKYFLRNYWDFCTKLFPLWMAPNLITLIGFIGTLITFVLALILIPGFSTPGPKWLYYLISFSVWFYSTLDNIDGRQARRTKSSSPLGEIFDHSVDSLQVLFISFLQSAGLGTGISWKLLLFNQIVTFQFFFITWETYHTSTLYLDYINGPTEGIIATCVAIAISGFYGIEFWDKTISFIIPLLKGTILGNLPVLGLVPISLIIFILFFTIPASIRRSEQTKKQNGMKFIALKESIPMVLLILTQWTPYLAKNSLVKSSGTMLILFMLSNGFIFTKMIVNIILAHIAKTEMPSHRREIVVPLAVSALYLSKTFTHFTHKLELCTILGYLAYSFSDLMIYSWYLSEDLCNFLNIKRFTINPSLEVTHQKSKT